MHAFFAARTRYKLCSVKPLQALRLRGSEHALATRQLPRTLDSMVAASKSDGDGNESQEDIYSIGSKVKCLLRANAVL